VHRRADDTLHWILGETAPPDLAAAREEEGRNEARQRERLWYVACTRARDLLVVPCLPAADSRSWSRIVDLGHHQLPELELSQPSEVAREVTLLGTNEQTAKSFAAEAETVSAASPPLVWRRPSDHDLDRLTIADTAIEPATEAAERIIAPGAGQLRGILLHKLMEEFLTGELTEEAAAVTARARDLLAQLLQDADDGRELPDAAELTATALRTLNLPAIAALRPSLVPELAIWSAAGSEFLAGRADAVAYDGGVPTLVLDWKSDVSPTAQDRAHHHAQLREYMTAIGVSRGAIVYMSLGEISWSNQ
jgi:ATP-dependent exoDNAse (exonuclease V) beta subunit